MNLQFAPARRKNQRGLRPPAVGPCAPGPGNPDCGFFSTMTSSITTGGGSRFVLISSGSTTAAPCVVRNQSLAIQSLAGRWLGHLLVLTAAEDPVRFVHNDRIKIELLPRSDASKLTFLDTKNAFAAVQPEVSAVIFQD